MARNAFLFCYPSVLHQQKHQIVKTTTTKNVLWISVRFPNERLVRAG